jgi:hypothetical protein
MVKRTTKSNVIKLPKAKTAPQSKEEKIFLAQQKVYVTPVTRRDHSLK